MTFGLVPIPPSHLEESKVIWFPFLSGIAERSKCDPDVMIAALMKGEAQACLIWNEAESKAYAFLGVRYVLRGKDRVGELIWLAGEHRVQWVHLLSDLEKYLKDEQGCVSIKAICRPGWKKHLDAHSYKLTHLVLEKEI